jgi:hypothetical protein
MAANDTRRLQEVLLDRAGPSGYRRGGGFMGTPNARGATDITPARAALLVAVAALIVALAMASGSSAGDAPAREDRPETTLLSGDGSALDRTGATGLPGRSSLGSDDDGRELVSPLRW